MQFTFLKALREGTLYSPRVVLQHIQKVSLSHHLGNTQQMDILSSAGPLQRCSEIYRCETARLSSVILGRSLSPRNSILTFTPINPPNPNNDRLRVWGPAYLGNATTADVYIKAAQFRKLDQIVQSSTRTYLIKKSLMRRPKV